MDDDRVRQIALDLPEATEQDHHGSPSFRVGGKIFATLPDPGFLHVMLDEPGIAEAVAESPTVCDEKWWGRRLAAVRVDLTTATVELVRELLTDAWRWKAPARLRDDR